jgi:hypothetical protein
VPLPATSLGSVVEAMRAVVVLNARKSYCTNRKALAGRPLFQGVPKEPQSLIMERCCTHQEQALSFRPVGTKRPPCCRTDWRPTSRLLFLLDQRAPARAAPSFLTG